MNETIIGALQEYLDQCPLLEGRRLNVDLSLIHISEPTRPY